MDEIELGK